MRLRKGQAVFENARLYDAIGREVRGTRGVYLPLEHLPRGCSDFDVPGWRCLILVRSEYDPNEEPAGALTNIREAWLIENTKEAP